MVRWLVAVVYIHATATMYDLSAEDQNRNPAVYAIIAAMHAIAYYICLLLFMQTLSAFKRKDTMYFWSMLAVCLGIAVETLGFTSRIFFSPITRSGIIYYVCMNVTSTILVRTGFGIVLYSRLYILHQSRWFQNRVMSFIITVAIIGHSGLIAYSICGLLMRVDVLQKIYNVWIYVEVVFTIQDVVLSSLYLWYFWQYLNDVPCSMPKQIEKECRKIFILLTLAYLWVIFADVSQFTLLCHKLYLARMMCLPPLEAIKLQIEFFVLNKLVEVGKMKQQGLGMQSIVSSLHGPVTSPATGAAMRRTMSGRPIPLMRESTGEMTDAGTLAQAVT